MPAFTFDIPPGGKLEYTFDFTAELDADGQTLEGVTLTVDPASPSYLTVTGPTLITGNKKAFILVEVDADAPEVEVGFICTGDITGSPDRKLPKGLVLRIRKVPFQATGGYTTVARMVKELNLTDETQQAMLAELIMEATAIFETATGRKFGYQANQVQTAYYCDSNMLALDITPVKAISGITVDGDTLDPSYYSIYNADAGIVTAPQGWFINFNPYWPESPYNTPIAVTYSGGYVLPGKEGRDLPYDIERAVIEIAKSLHFAAGSNARDSNIKSEEVPEVYSVTYGDSASSGGGTSTMPASALAVIQKWKRRFI